MTPSREVEALHRRLNSLARTAARIANHLDDLHALAYEPVSRTTEPDRSGFESRPPPGWKPGHENRDGTLTPNRANELFGTLTRMIFNTEAAFVDVERQLMGLFFAGSSTPGRSRGSLISAAEHDQLLARQKTRTRSVRIVPQPDHPAKEAR